MKFGPKELELIEHMQAEVLTGTTLFAIRAGHMKDMKQVLASLKRKGILKHTYYTNSYSYDYPDTDGYTAKCSTEVVYRLTELGEWVVGL